MLLMSRRHPKGLATTEPPLKLPIEGDNPTLRDYRIVVKKNPFILPGVFWTYVGTQHSPE